MYETKMEVKKPWTQTLCYGFALKKRKPAATQRRPRLFTLLSELTGNPAGRQEEGELN